MAWSKKTDSEKIKEYNRKYYLEKRKAKIQEQSKNKEKPVKICSLCGKEFNPVGNQKYCDKCKDIARKLRERRARNTKEYKERMKEYRQSESYKIVVEKYKQTDKYKQTRKEYYQSERGKEVLRKYLQSEKGKATMKRYYIKKKSQEN